MGQGKQKLSKNYSSFFCPCRHSTVLRQILEGARYFGECIVQRPREKSGYFFECVKKRILPAHYLIVQMYVPHELCKFLVRSKPLTFLGYILSDKKKHAVHASANVVESEVSISPLGHTEARLNCCSRRTLTLVRLIRHPSKTDNGSLNSMPAQS